MLRFLLPFSLLVATLLVATSTLTICAVLLCCVRLLATSVTISVFTILLCCCSAADKEEASVAALSQVEVSGLAEADRPSGCDDVIRRLPKTVGTASSLRRLRSL